MGPCKLTRSIATAASQKVGFDFMSILTIITAAMPVLSNLIKISHPNPTPQDYRREVTQRYRPKRETYQTRLLDQTTRALLSRSNEVGKPLKEDQAEELAVHFLDGVRTGSNEDIQEAIDLLKAGS